MPVNTSMFNGVLGPSANNVQAALDMLDDHTHGGGGGSWVSYTPAWTSSGAQPSLGNGTISGKYIRIGGVVIWKVTLTWGSTTSGGSGAWFFSAPVTALDTTPYSEPGGAVLNDSSVGQYIGQVIKYNSTHVYVQTDRAPNGVGQGTDFTWTTGDSLLTQSVWEA